MPRGGRRENAGRSVKVINLTIANAKLLRIIFEREKLAYNVQNVNTFVNRILTNVLEREIQ